MFKRRSSSSNTGLRIPLFAKLWFLLCGSLAIGTIVLTVFFLYSTISNPSGLGEFLAEIVNGYNQTIHREEIRQ